MTPAALFLAALLAQGASPTSGAHPSGVWKVNLEEEGLGDGSLRERLRAAVPGVDVRWFGATSRLLLPSGAPDTVLFVQTGAGVANLDGDTSEYVVGDVVLLRPEEELRFDPPAGVLLFELTEPLPLELPWIVRPDSDPNITDTPGGCATAYDAYRRIALTWREETGPYVHHGLNAHRVNVTDSFTHYHPVEGGFDELYLVQGAGRGAGLWIGDDLAPFLEPDAYAFGDSSGFLDFVPVRTGDLVYIPRGVVHRGVGGVLAHVIALPGFVPGTEIPVDDAIGRIDQRLGFEHPLARPYHGGPAWIDVRPGDEAIGVSIDHRPFLAYRLEDDPCFFPVIGPDGGTMTRVFPFPGNHEGEARDHPHHRSLWFAHGSVSGVDFWHEGPETVRPTSIGDHAGGLGRGYFETASDWLDAEGELVCRDRRRFEPFAFYDTWGLDVDITLVATEHGLTLGDTKEGTMALRVAPELKVDRERQPGSLVDSEGRSGKAVWGKRSRWILASNAAGIVSLESGKGGEPKGRQLRMAVALMDHPRNLRHPTTWHARTYGLLAANPFGLSDFEGSPKGTGDHVLPPNGELRLRYRVLFFAEHPTTAALEKLFDEFAGRD